MIVSTKIGGIDSNSPNQKLGNLMNLFCKTFYILNFQDFFCMVIAKIRNLQVGLVETPLSPPPSKLRLTKGEPSLIFIKICIFRQLRTRFEIDRICIKPLGNIPIRICSRNIICIHTPKNLIRFRPEKLFSFSIK